MQSDHQAEEQHDSPEYSQYRQESPTGKAWLSLDEMRVVLTGLRVLPLPPFRR